MDVTCSVFECEASAVHRGWCSKHYTRFKRFGSPYRGQRGPMVQITLAERIWSSFDRDDLGCWVWRGVKKEGAYGLMRIEGRLYMAHRVVYELLAGPIADGLQLDHLCRNRACVNPVHLEPVTPQVNVLRGVGMAAQHAAKDHCINGHPLAGDNLYIYPKSGYRGCRACRAAGRKPRRS